MATLPAATIPCPDCTGGPCRSCNSTGHPVELACAGCGLQVAVEPGMRLHLCDPHNALSFLCADCLWDARQHHPRCDAVASPRAVVRMH